MNFATGKFHDPKVHHKGWFRIFRFRRGVEVWFGPQWVSIDWS